MDVTLFIKFTRLLLAASVSIWMAGGCLFGCSNTSAMGAEVTLSSVGVAGENRHAAAQSHSCCTRPVAQKQKVQAKTRLRLPKEALAAFPHGALTNLPHGMKDCPLLANNTAATSKSSSSQPDSGRTSVGVLPSTESLSGQRPVTIASWYMPNHVPTHLRCCVFLI